MCHTRSLAEQLLDRTQRERTLKKGAADLSPLQSHVALGGTQNFAITVYTEEAQKYDISLRYGATLFGDSHVNVSVNGELQIEDSAVKYTGGHAAIQNATIGSITLQKGYNELRFTRGTIFSTPLAIYEIALKLAEPKTGVELVSFELQNSEGVRPPYGIADGAVVYGAATIKKFSDAGDGYRLFVAQYNDENQLLRVSAQEFSVADMEPEETKTFRTQLTLERDTGKSGTGCGMCTRRRRSGVQRLGGTME